MAAPVRFTKPDRPLTWLITGCSSGFGLALVRTAQAHGHTVIATSRDPARTPALVAEVTGRGGRWLALDVDDRNSGRLVEELEEQQGVHIDVLVNNAGWSVHNPVEQFTEDEVRAQMETLYFGPYRLIRAVVPYMRRRRYGVVVNISSGAGLEGRESMGVYAPGKAALDSVTKVLAKEVAEFNVRAFYVSLGGFDTNMPAAAKAGSVPLDPDYNGTIVGQTISFMAKGNYVAEGDSNKAVQAIYEVVVGEGIGRGREAERALPLGRDEAKRVQQIVDGWTHTMEVFGAICNNVYKTT